MRITRDISGTWRPFARQADFRGGYPIHSIPLGKSAVLHLCPDGTGTYENPKPSLLRPKSADFSYTYIEEYAWELAWRGGRAHGDVFGILAGGPLGDMAIHLSSTRADDNARRIILEKQTLMLIFTNLPPKGQTLYYYKD